jgi:hypothetical protein
MADIPFSQPARWRAGPNSGHVNLALSAAVLLALLIGLTWSWSAVATDIAEKRCDSAIGSKRCL